MNEQTKKEIRGIAFTIASNNINCLGITLTKKVKTSIIKNFKASKEVVEDYLVLTLDFNG